MTPRCEPANAADMDNAISDRLRQHRQNHPRAEVCEFLRGLLEDGYSVVSTASLAAPPPGRRGCAGEGGGTGGVRVRANASADPASERQPHPIRGPHTMKTLPCPKCAGGKFTAEESAEGMRVKCMSCGHVGPAAPKFLAAIRAWNKAQTDPAP